MKVCITHEELSKIRSYNDNVGEGITFHEVELIYNYETALKRKTAISGWLVGGVTWVNCGIARAAYMGMSSPG